jgi:hypothetical protein
MRQEGIGREGKGGERPFFKHPDAYLLMNFEHIGQERTGEDGKGKDRTGSAFLKRNTWKRH